MIQLSSVQDETEKDQTPQPTPRIAIVPSEGPNLLNIDQPTGILPARSRAVVKATFQPLRAGSFEISLITRVAAVDANGDKITLTAEESALLRIGDKGRVVAALQAETDAQSVSCATGTVMGDWAFVPACLCLFPLLHASLNAVVSSNRNRALAHHLQ